MSYYDEELRKFPETYQQAISTDISGLERAIAGAAYSSILAVGSGGSFTVASLLCDLHETYTGRVSRAATPLEIICNPTLATTSPIFFISAEGKNPDIVEALERARLYSSRAVHVLSNRSSSPLAEVVRDLTDIDMLLFEQKEKDGYLATNSLLLDAVLVARAYANLDRETDPFPQSIDALTVSNESNTVETVEAFAAKVIERGNVIVVYSPRLRAVAADFESKLAESALLHCQLTDLRSFAHGRHLWLAERKKDCAIVGLIDPPLTKLWRHMAGLFPSDIPTLTMTLEGTRPRDLLAGLLAQFNLISLLAKQVARDLGRPDVEQFGRDLYYTNLNDLVPPPKIANSHAEQSKLAVLGAAWPAITRRGPMERAAESFASSLRLQEFRAVIFDYDGPLCTSQRNEGMPGEAIVAQINRLVGAKVIVGVASGRGNSVQENLQKSLAKADWDKVELALYSGGWLGHLGEFVTPGAGHSEFLSHVSRIVGRLKTIGIPIEVVRVTHPYQASIRFQEGVSADAMWYVIADALRQAGLDPKNVVRSKHTVDVLAPGVSKSLLVGRLIQKYGIDPYQILTIGDQGAWPGNDFSLLEHKYSLSVDVPSRQLDRGWKLAPARARDVDATIWYLSYARTLEGGRVMFELPNHPT